MISLRRTERLGSLSTNSIVSISALFVLCKKGNICRIM